MDFSTIRYQSIGISIKIKIKSTKRKCNLNFLNHNSMGIWNFWTIWHQIRLKIQITFKIVIWNWIWQTWRKIQWKNFPFFKSKKLFFSSKLNRILIWIWYGVSSKSNSFQDQSGFQEKTLEKYFCDSLLINQFDLDDSNSNWKWSFGIECKLI